MLGEGRLLRSGGDGAIAFEFAGKECYLLENNDHGALSSQDLLVASHAIDPPRVSSLGSTDFFPLQSCRGQITEIFSLHDMSIPSLISRLASLDCSFSSLLTMERAGGGGGMSIGSYGLSNGNFLLRDRHLLTGTESGEVLSSCDPTSGVLVSLSASKDCQIFQITSGRIHLKGSLVSLSLTPPH
jgi:hypothetical protein